MLDKSFNFIKKIKRNFFPFYRNNKLRFVFNKLQEGFPKETITARFVGGCVRKHLSNDEIDDIDIATILSSDEIKEKFKNTNFKIENLPDMSNLTCFANDYGFENYIKKMISNSGSEGDILILISSSGKSKNMINALKEARKKRFSKCCKYCTR